MVNNMKTPEDKEKTIEALYRYYSEIQRFIIVPS